MWKNDVIIKLKKTIELIEFEFINIFSRFLCVSLFTVWQWLVSRLSSQLLAAEQPHTDTVHRVLLYMCVHSAIGRPSLHSLASPCVRWMYTPTPNQTCAWFTNTCSWSNEQHLRSIYCTHTHTIFTYTAKHSSTAFWIFSFWRTHTHTVSQSTSRNKLGQLHTLQIPNINLKMFRSDKLIRSVCTNAMY